jgi:hypothetical protein
MLGSSLPLATLGTMILWLGWFGFNGGSQLAMGSAADAVAIANIYVNTNLAAAGGVLASMVLTQIVYKKIDLSMVLNGAIAGLVSITAEPLTPSPGLAILIGAVGGVLAVFAVPLLYKLRIDDVVGAIPAHLVAGIWGTIAVPISNPVTSFTTQLVGIVGRRVHFPRQPARLVGAQRARSASASPRKTNRPASTKWSSAWRRIQSSARASPTERPRGPPSLACAPAYAREGPLPSQAFLGWLKQLARRC